jgi:hypothetical protein
MNNSFAKVQIGSGRHYSFGGLQVKSKVFPALRAAAL